MGDSHNDTIRVDFDRTIKLEFHGATVTSDAGLLAYRERDDALGLTSTAATGLLDTRTGQNTQHSLLALLRHRSTAGWPATRMATTRNASASIPPCWLWSVAAPVTTRCFSSTSSATWSRSCSGGATGPVPNTGGGCYCR